MSTRSQPSRTDDGWTGRRIDFVAFSAALGERRAAMDGVQLPRNAGKRRTASKAAMLKAVEEAGGEW